MVGINENDLCVYTYAGEQYLVYVDKIVDGDEWAIVSYMDTITTKLVSNHRVLIRDLCVAEKFTQKKLLENKYVSFIDVEGRINKGYSYYESDGEYSIVVYEVDKNSFYISRKNYEDVKRNRILWEETKTTALPFKKNDWIKYTDKSGSEVIGRINSVDTAMECLFIDSGKFILGKWKICGSGAIRKFDEVKMPNTYNMDKILQYYGGPVLSNKQLLTKKVLNDDDIDKLMREIATKERCRKDFNNVQ